MPGDTEIIVQQIVDIKEYLKKEKFIILEDLKKRNQELLIFQRKNTTHFMHGLEETLKKLMYVKNADEKN